MTLHRVTSVISPPDGVHPVWWALTSVVGLTPHRIRQRARVSRSVTDAMVTGRSRSVDSAAVRRLVDLLGWGRDELMRDAPDLRDRAVTPALRAYRRATFALLAEIHAEYAAPPAPAPPRETDLSRDVLLALGPHGQRRDLVVAALRRVHRPTAVRRAARRVGVVERLVDGHVHWIPPPARASQELPRYPAPSTPTPRPPTGERQRRLHDAISIFLGRRPDCTATGREVVEHLAPRGYHRSAIYRAARDMNLVRTTTGFGPQKRSVWSLPPAPPASDAPDDESDESDEPRLADYQADVDDDLRDG